MLHMKLTPHEKQWRTIHRTENEKAQIAERIAEITRDLGKKKKFRKLASEYHLTAHIYHKLVGTLPLGWDIMIAPTMSTRKKRYKKQAKNIPPFFIPDIVIYQKKTKVEGKKHPRSKSAKARFNCDRKNSIAIELSFQRKEKTKNKDIATVGVNLTKINDDRTKYKDERFVFHCVYVNQHPQTTLTRERFDEFSRLCNEEWFHYAGEDVVDNTGRLIFMDKNGRLVH